jgi:hypothetical protein
LTRAVAILYATVASIVAVWAWATDIALLHSEREHLLPDFVLAMVAMPLSLSLDVFYPTMRHLLDMPFAQLSFMTLCAAVQGTLLWLLAAWIDRKVFP